MAHTAPLEPIVLTGENLVYWFNASALVRTIAEIAGITAENLDEGKSLTLNFDEVQPPGGPVDWRLFSDLVAGHQVFTHNSAERKNANTVARRAVRGVAGVQNIMTREALINNIDFDPSLGYSREQALRLLDYLQYKTPGTMLTGLFSDFSAEPPLGYIAAHDRRRPAAAAAAHGRYNNSNTRANTNNNNYNNNNANNYADRRRGNREFQMEQLGRHAAAAAPYLNDNANNWNGPRPGKGKRRGGMKTRKSKRSVRRTRRA